MLILPAQVLAQAETIAEKLRLAVEQHHFNRIDSITISLGVAQFAGNELPIEFVDRVDKLLYQAKEQGRNCVVAE